MDMRQFLKNENEKPLDHIVNDGGFCSIFRTIGCIGDSLSSGEFEGMSAEGQKSYHDLYEYSWGQYLARICGSKVYNFSRGGMTAKEYVESFAQENDFWNPDKACQAYIIALGVNDLCGQNMEVGTAKDICWDDETKNAPTFAGYYGAIVQKYKKIQPDAKFFFMTMPRDTVNPGVGSKAEAQRELLYGLKNVFANSYILDLWQYGPDYNKEFGEQFFLGGHMNPCGYILTAKIVASYIDYLVRNHIDDFRQTGFIGTPYKYCKL